MTTVKIENDINLLSKSVCADIDRWIEKYPVEQKQSALLAALTIVQEANGGWLTEPLMEAVTDYLDLPAIVAYEAATFYSMYKLKPVGRHKINICTNISCLLCGSEKVVEYLEGKLNVSLGETTQDGRITLNEVECLGACVNAPMMQVDKIYHENLTEEKIDSILEELT